MYPSWQTVLFSRGLAPMSVMERLDAISTSSTEEEYRITVRIKFNGGQIPMSHIFSHFYLRQHIQLIYFLKNLFFRSSHKPQLFNINRFIFYSINKLLYILIHATWSGNLNRRIDQFSQSKNIILSSSIDYLTFLLRLLLPVHLHLP